MVMYLVNDGKSAHATLPMLPRVSGRQPTRLYKEFLRIHNAGHSKKKRCSPEKWMVGILSRFLLGFGISFGLFSLAFAVSFREISTTDIVSCCSKCSPAKYAFGDSKRSGNGLRDGTASA